MEKILNLKLYNANHKLSIHRFFILILGGHRHSLWRGQGESVATVAKSLGSMSLWK